MAVPAMAQNLTDLSTLCRAGGLRARQEIRCAFWRERRAGRCKAPRRRRCGDIVEERQRRRCPPAAAPLRAAARRPAGCVARSLHTAADAAGMLVARALPAGLGASSKMYTLFPDGPLAAISWSGAECVGDCFLRAGDGTYRPACKVQRFDHVY